MFITGLDPGETLLEMFFLVDFKIWILHELSDIDFDLTHDLDHGYFRVKFRIMLSQELLVWLMWNEKEANHLYTGWTIWSLPFDRTHDLNPEVSRSKFEIISFQEWEGLLTWHEIDVSQSFMTMSVTFVWPWWSGWIYRIVTGVTSDVGMPSTYLVYQISVAVLIEIWMYAILVAADGWS